MQGKLAGKKVYCLETGKALVSVFSLPFNRGWTTEAECYANEFPQDSATLARWLITMHQLSHQPAGLVLPSLALA